MRSNLSKCNTCAYYDEQNKEEGQCRINPPNLNGFPRVTASDWCGKYEMDNFKFKELIATN